MTGALRTAAVLALTLPACGGGAGQEVDGFVASDDGVRLYYRAIGDGPLQIVIPVGFYLEDALRPLAAPGRRVVFYDPRARGRSDAGDRSRVTLDRQIADLEALRRGLGIDSMVLIGWSGLGMEMAVYAMRYPERVMGLVQVAPVAARDRPHNETAYRTRAERLDTAALNAVDRRKQSGAFADDPAGYCRALGEITAPANFADAALARRVPDVCRFPNEEPDSLGPVFTALLGSFAGYDWRDAIARSAVPRLVIHGAADAFPLEGSREWVPPGSRATLLVVERAGHFPFLERPDVFFPAVEEFLGSLATQSVARARVWAVIAERDLIPEGTAYDPATQSVLVVVRSSTRLGNQDRTARLFPALWARP